MFVATKRPGWFCIMTRPSPELFGLIEATSNAGSAAAGAAWGVCARRRGAIEPVRTSVADKQASANRRFARFARFRKRGVGAMFISSLELVGRIIRLDMQAACLVLREANGSPDLSS